MFFETQSCGVDADVNILLLIIHDANRKIIIMKHHFNKTATKMYK